MHLKLMFIAAAFALMASPIMAEQVTTPPPPPHGLGLFDRADLNQDGVLTIQEVKAARASMFTRADLNKDGYIVKEEMRALRSPRPPKQLGVRRELRDEGPRREKRDLLADFDTNADGSVTRSEYDAGMARLAEEKQSEAQARGDNSFTRFDANKDGRLDKSELVDMRAKMKHPTKRPPFPPQLDTDKDGKISKDEWMASPDPLFERADTNKDGRLTREEAAAAARLGRKGGHHQRGHEREEHRE
ncbi:EF-hand domain-containing protein [Candidatus Phycosocius spiralis]|uniref:EF-hand domain-containing protein n=1 Tax=Candidatus Phycosocius spiralis TaxID=2815099 RepID=A0ABQ4PXA4_9PROT|nr:EF-hand domain-containing protein [Candidatus Phycosocius spiralis]GIU67594.1 hypothetical protein PsB1_1748 [Candidatus Phycosocius spiralis]